MARIRSIKPDILLDEKTASLSHLQWRLFVSLWLLADDFGNLRGRAAQIQGSALWATGETPPEIDAELCFLAEIGLIDFYEVGEQRYISVRGWAKHQFVKNPGRPLVPGIESGKKVFGSEYKPCPTDSLRNSSVDSTETLPLDRERDKEGEGEGEREREFRAEVRGAIDAGMSLLEVSKRGRPSKPKISLPDDWNPNGDAIQRCIAAGLSVEREVELFRNHAAEKDRKCADWNAAFRNWIIRSIEFKGSKGKSGGMSTFDILDYANDLERQGR